MAGVPEVNDQISIDHQAAVDRRGFKRRVSKQLCWDDDYFEECVSAEALGIKGGTIQDYRRMFQLFDNDEDGSISVRELRTVLQSFGHDTSEESIRRIMSDYDKDGDGAIEFPEFLTAISKIMNDADSETELIEIFRIIDQDGDGTISKSDLREVSKRIGLSLSNRDMDDMFEVADKDSDGRVDFEEFSKIILSRH